VKPMPPVLTVVAVTPVLVLWKTRAGGSAEAGAAGASRATAAARARTLMMVRMVESLLRKTPQA
jgi:hypothetical protein